MPLTNWGLRMNLSLRLTAICLLIRGWRNGKTMNPISPPGKRQKSEEVKAAEKTEDVYKRLIKQQQEQIATGSQNTELAKMKYQVTQGS
ncbi:Uncharacterised protein [Klebsiella quasipneumoniae]|uniref:hypothetical protein n=1 Tax=Klebsiella quasipneumoniae TaxID=1463165 RepID=UPI0024CB2724|nr:hypothetical protein [Klebsiella quasipneumoniae]CAH1466129.1 Uncharacterised protein [Klebsiella quasipneumoniae]